MATGFSTGRPDLFNTDELPDEGKNKPSNKNGRWNEPPPD